MNLPEKRKIEERKKRHKIRHEQGYKLVYISVACFFIGFFLATQYAFMTIISFTWALRIFLVCLAISYVAQTLFFKTYLYMRRMEYLMVAFFAGAPVLSAVILMLNYYVHTSSYTEVYTISKVSNKGAFQYFEAPGLPCEDHPELCVVHESYIDLRRKGKVEIEIATGLFGFQLISDVREIQDFNESR